MKNSYLSKFADVPVARGPTDSGSSLKRVIAAIAAAAVGVATFALNQMSTGISTVSAMRVSAYSKNMKAIGRRDATGSSGPVALACGMNMTC